MTSKIISFDIGIKNMAFCVFTVNNYTNSTAINEDQYNTIKMEQWQVINLMPQTAENTPVFHCSCLKTKKRKNDLDVQCGKIAKYQKRGTYYCESHSKTAKSWLIPKKEFLQTSLKKKKNEDLLKLFEKYKIPFSEPSVKKTKTVLLGILENFFKENCFETLGVLEKGVSAKEVDLITIGRNMKICMDNVTNIEDVTHVLMENQISTLASRMKTIQGMLAQYFIIKYPLSHIEFISSFNKLKYFSKKSDTNLLKENSGTLGENPGTLENTVISTQKTTTATYKQHKLDGVFYAKQILDKHLQFHSWKSYLDTKKKDDLADCFLQGWWYITTKL